MADDTSQLIDLDAIAPAERQIKIEGKIYKMLPPKLKLMPALARQLKKMANLALSENEDEALGALDEFNNIIRSVIPDLPDEVDFTMLQAEAIVNTIQDMVTPPEQRALRAEGIEPSSKKNTDTVS